MGIDNYSTNGLGFYCSKISDEKLNQFILNHEKTILEKGNYYANEILQYVKDGCKYGSVRNRHYDYESYVSGDMGACAIVSNIMHWETGISFGYYVSNVNDVECIMLAEMMPWDVVNADLRLTYNKLTSIIEEYTCELGIHSPFTVNYLSCEYSG